jgi:hypothetical protein
MSTSSFQGSLWVKPGSRRTAVGGAHGEPPALIVRVSKPAAGGQANRAVVAAVAASIGVRAAQVRIASGEHSRGKRVVIEEPPADLAQRWATLLSTVV